MDMVDRVDEVDGVDLVDRVDGEKSIATAPQPDSTLEKPIPDHVGPHGRTPLGPVEAVMRYDGICEKPGLTQSCGPA